MQWVFRINGSNGEENDLHQKFTLANTTKRGKTLHFPYQPPVPSCEQGGGLIPAAHFKAQGHNDTELQRRLPDQWHSHCLGAGEQAAMFLASCGSIVLQDL